MSIGFHQSAKAFSDDWITPPEILDDLGPFALDPCASLTQPWPTAGVMWTVRDDGRMRPWFGFVWMNPPYGAQLGLWLRRLSEHGNGIALVFARTETEAFQQYVWPKATALRFVYGRLAFYRPDGSCTRTGGCGGPSVLIGYGEEAARRLERSGIPGKLVRL